MFMQLLVNGLVTGSVYAIAAVGVSLVYGILRLVNFAYGDMMTFGAFAGYFANATLGLPMIASAAFAMAAGAALSIALDVVLWRPLRLRRAGFMALFLASIGVALVLRQAILLVWGPQPRTYDVDPFKVYVVGDVRLSLAQVATIVSATLAIVAIGLFLARTSTGRVMRALSDDRTLAQVSGIDVNRVVVVTWIISGATAGLAGVLAPRGCRARSTRTSASSSCCRFLRRRRARRDRGARTAPWPAGSCSASRPSSRRGRASTGASIPSTSQSSRSSC